MDNVVSHYVFGCTDNKGIQKRDPCRLEKWERFLEGVELKALEDGKSLNWERRGKPFLGWNGRSKSPKLGVMCRNKKSEILQLWQEWELTAARAKVLLARENQVTRDLTSRLRSLDLMYCNK